MENKNANVVRILNNATIIQTIKQKLNQKKNLINQLTFKRAHYDPKCQIFMDINPLRKVYGSYGH